MQIFLTKKYYTILVVSGYIHIIHTYSAKGANRHFRGLVGLSKFLQYVCSYVKELCIHKNLEIKITKINLHIIHSYS